MRRVTTHMRVWASDPRSEGRFWLCGWLCAVGRGLCVWRQDLPESADAVHSGEAGLRCTWPVVQQAKTPASEARGFQN